jgi:hypothetical protein
MCSAGSRVIQRRRNRQLHQSRVRPLAAHIKEHPACSNDSAQFGLRRSGDEF